jgi:hypothetical protein
MMMALIIEGLAAYPFHTVMYFPPHDICYCNQHPNFALVISTIAEDTKLGAETSTIVPSHAFDNSIPLLQGP